LSFGNAAYFALGAYSVALVYRSGVSAIWLPFFAAIAVTFIVAIGLGYLSVRLTKVYFSFLTMAFAQMIYTILFLWQSFTGGDDGIPNVPRGVFDIHFVKISLESSQNFYYFSLILFGILILLLRKLVNSYFGLALRSIRENTERASFVGLNLHRYVLIAFVISAMYSGIGGALQASLTKMAYPELSYWSTSGEPILMTLIGGVFTFSGPFVGALIYILLKTYLMSVIGNWMLFLGGVLLVLVLFFRTGVMGYFQEKSGVEL
jgi:branched-chain amino acid transport system permease protein